MLDRKLTKIRNDIDKGYHPRISVTYFVDDEFKGGGRYEAYEGTIKKVDTIYKRVIFYAANGTSNGREIEINRIIEISDEE